jgi:hypothetical protein
VDEDDVRLISHFDSPFWAGAAFAFMLSQSLRDFAAERRGAASQASVTSLIWASVPE